MFDTLRKGKARLSEGSFFKGRGYVTIVRCNEERDRMCLTSSWSACPPFSWGTRR